MIFLWLIIFAVTVFAALIAVFYDRVIVFRSEDLPPGNFIGFKEPARDTYNTCLECSNFDGVCLISGKAVFANIERNCMHFNKK